MTLTGTIALVMAGFIVGATLTGWMYAPEKYPTSTVKWELIGWAFFAAAVITWEIAKK